MRFDICNTKQVAPAGSTCQMLYVLNYASLCELSSYALLYEISTYLCQMNTVVKLFNENSVHVLLYELSCPQGC